MTTEETTAPETELPGDDAPAAPRGSRRSFGIAPRLFLAFGCVAALILLACGVALVSGRNVQKSFSVATDRSVPAMTTALTLQSNAASLAAAAPLLAAAADDKERQAALDRLNEQWAALEAGVNRLEKLGVRPERIEAIRGGTTALAGATGNLNRAVVEEIKLNKAIAEKRDAVVEAQNSLLDTTDKAAEQASTNTSISGVSTGMKLEDGIKEIFEKRVPQFRQGLETSAAAERLGRLLVLASVTGDAAALDGLAADYQKDLEALKAGVAALPEGEWTKAIQDQVAALEALGKGPDSIFDKRREALASGMAAPGTADAGALDALRGRVAAATQALDAQLKPAIEKAQADVAEAGQAAATAGSGSIRSLMDHGVTNLQGILTMKAEANRMAGLMGQATTAPSLEALKELKSDFGSRAALSAMALLRAEDIRDQLEPQRAALQALGEKDGNIFELRTQQLAAIQQAGDALAKSRDAAAQLGEQVTAMVGDVRGDLDSATASVTGALGRSEILQFSIAGACLVVSLLIAWLYVGRNLVRRLQRLASSMREIAEGDLTAEVPVGGRDEIAEMAGALTVFRDGLAEAEAERGRNEAEREAAQTRRRQEMLALAEGFETSVKGVVESVSSSASEMQSTAETMAGTAEHASSRATAVATASEETSGNVQSAAAAARELANSISEIARQVSHSTDIAREASNKAESTNVQVEGLSAAAQKIGEVVSLISEIAEQTNLLALNATIEAARAGEAGRGFAVVASEVKSLASQTAKATEEIAAQIGGMQSATGEAVEAIRSIGTVIGQMSEIATSISAAVEEQGAATDEIAQTMNRAADGTQTVAGNITGVTEAANETGTASAQVLSAAGELAKNAETLAGQVDRFLERIRAA